MIYVLKHKILKFCLFAYVKNNFLYILFRTKRRQIKSALLTICGLFLARRLEGDAWFFLHLASILSTILEILHVNVYYPF